MSKEYFISLKKQDEYEKKNQLFLKNRVFITFKNLIKTFFNKNIEKDQLLLDLGSADGTFVEVVKNNGLKSKGLDINEINFENDKVNFQNESCDIITLNSVIEHINNPNNLLNEVKRLLKKNGFFIIVTPDWSLTYKTFFDDPTHVRPYTEKSLHSLLDSYGFKNIKIVPWLVCKPLWMWKVPFSFLLARLLPFKGGGSWFIPEFLKGKSKTLLAICTKINNH